MSAREKYSNIERIVHNCGQRSATWFNLKLGKVSGSNAHKLTTPAKMETYYYELLAETIARTITEGHLTEAMQWGIDNEPFAAEWYQSQTNSDVSICGFVEMDKAIMGCSPDLLVGSDGMAQIKCPSTKQHLDYRDNGPSKEIIYQMQWEIFIADREWNDFISFDPRCKGLEGHIQRIERDDKLIDKLVSAAEELQDKIEIFLFDNNITPVRYVPVPEEVKDDAYWDKQAFLRA